VNYAFIDHFQTVARAHFTIRRLERSYGKDVVRSEYEVPCRDAGRKVADAIGVAKQRFEGIW